MIDIHQPAPERLDLVVRGTLDENAVQGAVDELETKLVDGLRLLLDLREFEDITAKGFVRDVVEGVHLAGRLARCRRIAVVAAGRWLRAASRVDGALLPGVEVRTFGVGQIKEARDWLDADADAPAQAIDPTEASRPAIRLVESARPTLLEMVIDGYLDDDDIGRLMPEFERALEGDAPIDMLVRIESFRGFAPELLTDRATWRLKREGLKRLRRCAVVTSIGWLASAVAVIDKVVSPELRTFSPEEEPAARAWLDDGAASA